MSTSRLPSAGPIPISTDSGFAANCMASPGSAASRSRQNAREVRLDALRLRVNERFLYEYDFNDWWEHQVRIERKLPADPKRRYPVCIGGRRSGPPEDCDGPAAFIERSQSAPWQACQQPEHLAEDVSRRDVEAIRDRFEQVESLREWLDLEKFDRREANRRLTQYASGDDRCPTPLVTMVACDVIPTKVTPEPSWRVSGKRASCSTWTSGWSSGTARRQTGRRRAND